MAPRLAVVQAGSSLFGTQERPREWRRIASRSEILELSSLFSPNPMSGPEVDIIGSFAADARVCLTVGIIEHDGATPYCSASSVL